MLMDIAAFQSPAGEKAQWNKPQKLDLQISDLLFELFCPRVKLMLIWLGWKPSFSVVDSLWRCLWSPLGLAPSVCHWDRSEELVTASSCAREGSGWMLGNTTSLKGWSGTGMGCPGRWWSHRPWRCSRNVWTLCWGTWFSENYWWWVDGWTGWSCGSFLNLVILCFSWYGGDELTVELDDCRRLFQLWRFNDSVIRWFETFTKTSNLIALITSQLALRNFSLEQRQCYRWKKNLLLMRK